MICMAKKENIRSLFDNIAPDYDKLNHILSLNIDKGWRKKAVREIADVQQRLEVLDAKMHSGLAILSSSPKVVFFTSISSNAASTIKSLAAASKEAGIVITTF